MLAQIQEMLANKGGHGNGSGEHVPLWGQSDKNFVAGETSFHEGSTSGDVIIKAKTVRLDFPRFDGEDPETWSCRAE
jgi:hypothetical protein